MADDKKLREMLKEIEGLDRTINNLESMREQVMKNGKPIKKAAQLQKITRHINYLVGLRDSLKNNIEQEAKDKKEKEEKLERIRTGYYLAAVYNREMGGFTPDLMYLNNESVLEDIVDNLPGKKELVNESLIDRIFDYAREKNLSAQKVEQILEDKEFAEMELHDPNKLLREKKQINDELTSIVQHLAIYENRKLAKNEDGSIDKEAVKESFKEHLKELNGFEKGRTAINKYLANVKVRDFEDIIQETISLADDTRKLQKEYIANDAGFDRSNGYTRELLDRELKLMQKITLYNKKLTDEMMDAVNPMKPGSIEDLMKTDFFERYSLIQEMDFHIKKQIKVDECLVRNNEHLARMEEWEAYRQMRMSINHFDENGAKEFNRRLKASTKLHRIMSEADKGSEALAGYSQHAGIQAQTMLDILSKQGRLNAKDQEVLKDCVAAITLFGIVRDYDGNDKEAEKYIKEIQKADHLDNYKQAADLLKNDERFQKKYAEMFGKNPTKSGFYEFLARDNEKFLSPTSEIKLEKRFFRGNK